MLIHRSTLLSLYAIASCGVYAQVESAEQVPVDGEAVVADKTPKLNVGFAAKFLDAGSVLGTKLVNGKENNVAIDIHNQETRSVKLVMVGGALLSLKESDKILSNITAWRPNLDLAAGEQRTVNYKVKTDIHPVDVRFQLAAAVQDGNTLFTYQVFNETVSIVDAPLSIFDPQVLFLYLFIFAALGGIIYLVYDTYFTTLFPQFAKKGKSGRRAKASTTGKKPVDPSEQVAVLGGDGPAVTSSAKYDESWIPAQHLQRPEARRVGSGRNQIKSKSKAQAGIP